MNCDEFPGRLREICDGTARKGDGSEFTEVERRKILNRRIKRNGSTVPAPTPPDVSKIGTILKRIIKEQSGHGVPCGECQAEIVRLNTMTSSQVLNEIDALAQRIYDRSKKNAQKWHHKMVLEHTPALAMFEFKRWIRRACEENDSKEIP